MLKSTGPKIKPFSRLYKDGNGERKCKNLKTPSRVEKLKMLRRFIIMYTQSKLSHVTSHMTSQTTTRLGLQQ